MIRITAITADLDDLANIITRASGFGDWFEQIDRQTDAAGNLTGVVVTCNEENVKEKFLTVDDLRAALVKTLQPEAPLFSSYKFRLLSDDGPESVGSNCVLQMAAFGKIVFG